jgi:hypothetical protein
MPPCLALRRIFDGWLAGRYGKTALKGDSAGV